MFAIVALIAVLALVPPEARGEGMAGAAALMLLLLTLVGRPRGLPILALLAASCWPLAAAAAAPGEAVAPLAVVFLAALTGLSVAALPEAVRSHSALPRTVAVVGAVVSVHALWQSLGGLASAAAALRRAGPIADRAAVLARLDSGRAFAAFPTPAALGAFLAIALSVTVAAGFAARPGRSRIAWLTAAALEAAALLATRSATALGALALAVLAFAVWRSRRRAALVAGAAVVLALLAVVALRGREILDLEHPNNPFRLRAGNFRVAAAIAVDHPWIGVGPGGYGEAYPQYRTAGENESRHAHDLPLELAADFGIPLGAAGTVLFFGLLLGPAFRRSGRGPGWRTGAAVGLAAFALQNLGDFTAFLPSLLWTAAILRGLVARPDPDPPAAPGALRLPVGVAAIVAAAIAAGAGLSWNARHAAREAVAAGDASGAERLASRAVRLAPWDVDARLILGNAVLSGGVDTLERRVEAATSADAAVRLSPLRAAARALRGTLREAGGDLPGAYADFAAAARLNPGDAAYARARDARLRVIRTSVARARGAAP